MNGFVLPHVEAVEFISMLAGHCITAQLGGGLMWSNVARLFWNRVSLVVFAVDVDSS